MKKTYSIAVLDDHALIIEAIKSLLQGAPDFPFTEGFQTYEAFQAYLASGKELDILLLDIQLENQDGIKLCEKIHLQHPNLRIIMLSSNTQPHVVMDALKKGAKGFLPKNVSLAELKEAFRETLNGKTYLHKDISLIPSERKISRFDYLPKLTRREKEVLKLILEEMTTTEIAEKLFLSPSTVETHRASLFSKTNSKNVVGLIKYTLEKGLLED